MDDATLTQKAIEEIIRDAEKRSMENTSVQHTDQEKCQLGKPNKRFLDTTINNILTHNKRESDRTKKNCQLKLEELEHVNNSPKSSDYEERRKRDSYRNRSKSKDKDKDRYRSRSKYKDHRRSTRSYSYSSSESDSSYYNSRSKSGSRNSSYRNKKRYRSSSGSSAQKTYYRRNYYRSNRPYRGNNRRNVYKDKPYYKYPRSDQSFDNNYNNYYEHPYNMIPFNPISMYNYMYKNLMDYHSTLSNNNRLPIESKTEEPDCDETLSLSPLNDNEDLETSEDSKIEKLLRDDINEDLKLTISPKTMKRICKKSPKKPPIILSSDSEDFLKPSKKNGEAMFVDLTKD